MKRLWIALLISASLNVGLVATFAYRRWAASRTPSRDPFREARRGAFKLSPRPEIVFVGDSLTEFGLWSEWIPGAANRGILFETSAGLLARIGDIVAEKPAHAWVMIGSNDFGQKPEIDTVANIAAITGRLKAAGVAVHLQSIPPSSERARNVRIRRINAELRTLCSAKQMNWVDLFPALSLGDSINPAYTYDGKHFTGEGYGVWIRAVRKSVHIR